MSESFPAFLFRMGENLNRIRVEADMTQKELAHAAGISKSFLGGMEVATVDKDGKPVKVPTIRTLWMLAEVLDCDVGDFFAYGSTPDEV